MTNAQMIMTGIIAYFLIFHVLKYAISYWDYKRELRRRKTGPPRAYYQPLQKPKFFNYKSRLQ